MIRNLDGTTTILNSNVLTDEHIDLLGQRFQHNQVGQLCDITFERYLDCPHDFDHLARHMSNGGSCLKVDCELVI